MWFSLGTNSYGKRVICGPFSDETEAREKSVDQIPQISDVIELPTKSLDSAKKMIKFRQAQSSHDLDDGLQNIRGNTL